MNMEIAFSQKVVAPDSVLFRELGGEAVLLNLDNESYYGLDEVGTRMWNLLTTSPSIQDAHAALLDEYDVEPERLAADVRELVGELVEQGLLTVAEG